jgi:beta-galactosidase
MKKKLIVGVFTAALLLQVVLVRGQVAAPDRAKYNFNPGWRMLVGDPEGGASAVAYNDNNWKAVTVPHAFNEDDAFKKPIDALTTGIVWYRKHFRIPAARKGQKVFLEFEGIRHAGEVYLNGTFVGRHENGIMAFGFDITEQVKWEGENVLAVRIDNSWNYHEKATNSTYQWNDKNFYANYGGINKNVFLHFFNKLYQTLPLYSNLGTTGVYVYARDFDLPGAAATIHAASEVKNETGAPATVAYQVAVADRDGKVIASFNSPGKILAAGETATLTAAGKASGLHFWSWGYGYLYQVSTALLVNGKKVDVVNTTTGFRKTAFTNGALQLNDRTIQLKGYAQRTTNEWPAIGSAVPAWLSDLSNGLMVESGANLVRWMHVTPWKQDVESCDRMGLIQAMPAGDSEKDVDGRRWEQRVEVMRDAIIYNRNNPSIIFYECGNKGISEAHMAELKKVRDEYDAYGGRAIGSREMLNHTTAAEYGGEMLYINKSAGKPLWAMEYSRDEGLRKYWDAFTPPYHKDGDGPLYKGEPAAIYNRNQDSHAIEDVVRWYDYWKERPGTGKRVNAGGVNIIFSESNTHYRGAENYRRSGEVDAMRIPKDGFYAHQAIWDGWVDDLKPRLHILGHWNYATGVTKDIYVVSSADKVELFVNGQSLGFGEQSSRFLYTFKNITWQPGAISAIGYSAAGKKICEGSHSTAGAPAAIRLTYQLSPKGWVANGADLALVQVEVVDAKGNRCPTALDTIHFRLTGAAEWRGGMAQGEDNFIGKQDLPVECGVNRIFLRSLPKAGTVVLTATMGKQAAQLILNTRPFENKEGLSTQMPDQGLTGSLKRGPTPAGVSYVVSRTPVTITAATAGSNADKAALSYDDDETTDWFNDGDLANAWIDYTLERTANISEVTFKVNGFRTKSYPVRITIDGKEAFKGNTLRGLGYCTLTFPPVKGNHLKIELLSAAEAKEETGKEVNGKKLGDGVERNDQNSKGRLSLIEMEIYEKI